MLYLAAVAALVVTDAHFQGRAEARLETRARTSYESTNAAAADAEVTPALWGSVENLGGRLVLLYAPTLRAREPYSDERRSTEFNHSQTFEASWERQGRPRFYLLENFYQGTTDLAMQQGATSVLLNQRLSQLSIDVSGGVAVPLTKLITWDNNVGFFYGTGLDAVSRGYIPSQRAWRLRESVQWELTARDRLSGAFNAQYAIFPGRFEEWGTFDLAARYRRQLIATTAVEVGLLGALIVGRDAPNPDDPADVHVVDPLLAPGGDVLLSHRVTGGPHQLSFDLGLRIAPFLDRYLSTAYERAELSSTVGYIYQERWQFTGRAGVGRSLSPVHLNDDNIQYELLSTFIEARAGYVAPRFWRVELAGVNSTFVLGNAPAVNNWLVSLSLTLHAEGQI